MAPYVPKFTPQAIAERKTWQYRAIVLLGGNKTMLGAIVVAMTGLVSKPPYVHPMGAKIEKDDTIWALFHDGSRLAPKQLYGSVQEFTDIFRGLAAELGLSEAEKIAMFDEIRKFVVVDKRAHSNLDGGINYRKGRN